MKKPDYMILVCNSYRVASDAKGACSKKNAIGLLQYITEGCSDRNIDAVVTTSACLNVCTQGPIMVIQPSNYWYGEVNEDKIDTILDALAENKAINEYLISD